MGRHLTDRYQYRKMRTLDNVLHHTVFDMLNGSTMSLRFDSKYAAKRWIKNHQEEYWEEN